MHPFECHYYKSFKRKYNVKVDPTKPRRPQILRVNENSSTADQDQSPKFFYSYGAITSIILGMKICWEYLKLIDGGKNSNYVVSPPAILLLASVFFDMIFSFSILIDTQTDGVSTAAV